MEAKSSLHSSLDATTGLKESHRVEFEPSGTEDVRAIFLAQTRDRPVSTEEAEAQMLETWEEVLGVSPGIEKTGQSGLGNTTRTGAENTSERKTNSQDYGDPQTKEQEVVQTKSGWALAAGFIGKAIGGLGGDLLVSLYNNPLATVATAGLAVAAPFALVGLGIASVATVTSGLLYLGSAMAIFQLFEGLDKVSRYINGKAGDAEFIESGRDFGQAIISFVPFLNRARNTKILNTVNFELKAKLAAEKALLKNVDEKIENLFNLESRATRAGNWNHPQLSDQISLRRSTREQIKEAEKLANDIANDMKGLDKTTASGRMAEVHRSLTSLKDFQVDTKKEILWSVAVKIMDNIRDAHRKALRAVDLDEAAAAAELIKKQTPKLERALRHQDSTHRTTWPEDARRHMQEVEEIAKGLRSSKDTWSDILKSRKGDFDDDLQLQIDLPGSSRQSLIEAIARKKGYDIQQSDINHVIREIHKHDYDDNAQRNIEAILRVRERQRQELAQRQADDLRRRLELEHEISY